MRKIFALLLICLSGCIGTDVLDDMMATSLSIQTRVRTVKVGETFQLQARYLDNVGQPAEAAIQWLSSDPGILSVDGNGLLTALTMGASVITASASGGATDTLSVMVTDTTVMGPDERTAIIHTVSTYPLSGTVTLRKTPTGGLVLDFAEDFHTTAALPGLYVYLSNNINTTSGAVELGKVLKADGSQSFAVPGNVGLFQYEYALFFCKPFVVPVGNGKLNP